MTKPATSLVIFLGILIYFPLGAKDDFPAITADGLHLVPDTQLRLVYADPDADLAVYSKLLLIEPQVAFRKDWRRDINRNKPYDVTAQDMQNIRSELAALFKEILLSKLEASDHILVEEQGEDRTRNEKAARRILDGWAELLVNGLNETMQLAPGRKVEE